MDRKIEEARQEFNAIIDYILKSAHGREIHTVEDGIYRRLLRLGRILLELFVLATGTGKIGESLTGEDGTGSVEEFMDYLPSSPEETEGAIVVDTVDCKGVRMRPEERNPDAVKTQDKPGEKRMACVAQTYSIDPICVKITIIREKNPPNPL